MIIITTIIIMIIITTIIIMIIIITTIITTIIIMIIIITTIITTVIIITTIITTIIIIIITTTITTIIIIITTIITTIIIIIITTTIIIFFIFFLFFSFLLLLLPFLSYSVAMIASYIEECSGLSFWWVVFLDLELLVGFGRLQHQLIQLPDLFILKVLELLIRQVRSKQRLLTFYRLQHLSLESVLVALQEQEEGSFKMSSPEEKKYETRSECSRSSKTSKSSKHSVRSAASLAALGARARAEAARARALHAQREIDVKVKKAQLKVEETRLDATLEAIQQEKEADAASAEANVFESAVDLAAMGELTGIHDVDQGSSYHSAAVNSNSNDDSQTHHEPPSQSERQRLSAKATMPTATTAYSKRPPLQFTPKRESEFIASHPASEPKNRWTPRHDTADYSFPQGGESTTYASVLGRFLARRELLTAGLTKFNDKPENYWAWRSAFSNATEDLGLKPSEELDLLIKWLGPESAEHARRVRSVRINYPGEALSMVWQRLEEVYGSPEAMETALFNKLERFPKFSNKEPKRLRELGDLLLEEKWMVHGTKYKEEHHTIFPPFSVFADFIRAEAKMRNDPSFAAAAPSNTPPKWEKFSTKSAKTPIAVHKTEVDNPAKGDETKASDNLKKECPIHKKPHPLTKCRAFRAKLLDERKAFLKENGICFRCCSSTSHQAKDCKAIIQCSECNSDKHIAALHAGPAPCQQSQLAAPLKTMAGRERNLLRLQSLPQSAQRSVETAGQPSPVPKSVSSMYILKTNLRRRRAYAILDDQSNRSLARSSVFEMFNIADNTSPYTLKTCAGVSEAVGRRARGFIMESADEKTSLALPTLIECDQIPDNRAEIPTPAAVKYHPHLKSLISKIPPLDPEDLTSFRKGHYSGAQGPGTA
ncbi:hypothetical protein NFI96_009502 [Prochilodus magdalenae]|nr:hypothetical protein NFI96_009502 [Prochilodus magdalenae]